MDAADAVSDLYDEKCPDGQMTSLEWNQFNKDLWAALVHFRQEKQQRRSIIAAKEKVSWVSSLVQCQCQCPEV